MTIALEDAFFKASDATTSRLLKDHIGDVLNVKSFGATGDGSTDDYTAIQTCFDTAFGGPLDVGGASDPHGVDLAHLNRAVFFPPGNYHIESSLTLNNLYGASIFGSGMWTSNISVSDNALSLLVINGMKDCVLRDLRFAQDGSNPSAIGIDLDWDGDPGVNGTAGLGHNLFDNFAFGSSGFSAGTNTGLRLGHSGFEGHCNQFIKSAWGAGSTSGIGVLVEAGSGNLFQGGGSGGPTVIKCTGGSIHVNTLALAADAITYGFHITSPLPCTIQGVRTESNDVFLRAEGARVWVCNENYSLGDCTIFAELVSNASVVFDTCATSGDITATAGCNVYVRNCYLPDVDFAGLLADGVLPQNI